MHRNNLQKLRLHNNVVDHLTDIVILSPGIDIYIPLFIILSNCQNNHLGCIFYFNLPLKLFLKGKKLISLQLTSFHNVNLIHIENFLTV